MKRNNRQQSGDCSRFRQMLRIAGRKDRPDPHQSIAGSPANTVTMLETVRERRRWALTFGSEEQNIHSMSGDGELMLTILAFAQEESKKRVRQLQWRIRKVSPRGSP